jgi:hypothetical protein
MARMLGFDFNPLRPEDQTVLEPFLTRYPQTLSGYTFAPLVAWNPMFHYEWALLDNETLLLSFAFEDSPRQLLQPVGNFPVALQRCLLDRGAALGYPLKIVGATREFVEAHPELVRHMKVEEDRPASNYVYRAKDLANLSGKKYAAKRNHIAQASAAYDWKAKPLLPADVPGCLDLVRDVCAEIGELKGLPRYEHVAITYTLEHFAELRQEGVRIEVDGKTEAFAIWEKLNPTTAVVHFERARRSLKGLYQVINRETARVMVERGFELVNREEDIGDPGLRKAKSSYHPVEIVPALTLTLKPRQAQ